MARELLKTITDRRKNYFINGDMSIAQRGTSFAAAAGSTYSLDRMFYQKNGSMIHTISQDTDVPTVEQAGYAFKNSMRFNLTTPDTSLAAGEFVAFGQKIEGYNFANLSGRAFTVSFWVKATLPGTYCVSFTNSSADRTWVSEYTINSANTWEKKTVNISASPSSGTWNYTNGTGLWVRWCLGTGTNGQTGTVNSWISGGGMVGTTNQVNGVNTGATDFRITGVMINEGVTAAPFSLFGSDYSTESRICKRYYEVIRGWHAYPVDLSASTTTGQFFIQLEVEKRNSPSVSLGSTFVANSRYYGPGGLRGIASAVAAASSTQVAGIQFTVSGAALTQYTGGTFMTVSNLTDDTVIADAEL